MKYCRGHGLFGPQFMRCYGSSRNPSTCFCESKLCEKIGYSHHGMFRLPQHPEKFDAALRVLGVSSNRQKEMAKNPRVYQVAPWHYSPRHREKNAKNGCWSLRKMSKYKDDDGKCFDYPPPNYSVQTYIQSEIQSFLPRGSHDNTLPWWARDLQKAASNIMDIDTPINKQPPAIASRSPLKTNTTPKRPTSTSKTQRTSLLTTTPRQRKRALPEKIELEEEKENSRVKDAEIASGLHRIEELMALLNVREEQINELQHKLNQQSE